MTEKQKNIRSLTTTLAVLLTVTTLFFVFFYAVLPLVNRTMIENSGVGAYIYLHKPQTLEEYNEIIAKENKASLSEVEKSLNVYHRFKDTKDTTRGYDLLNIYRPEYVFRIEGYEDCFIAKYGSKHYQYADLENKGNYVIMVCTPYGTVFSVEDITPCFRSGNAPSCSSFSEQFPKNRLLKQDAMKSLYQDKFGTSLELGYMSAYAYSYSGTFLILLSDGVAVIELEEQNNCKVIDIIPYEAAENVNGVPARALIDLFDEHERSEG